MGHPKTFFGINVRPPAPDLPDSYITNASISGRSGGKLWRAYLEDSDSCKALLDMEVDCAYRTHRRARQHRHPLCNLALRVHLWRCDQALIRVAILPGRVRGMAGGTDIVCHLSLVQTRG